MPGPHRLADAGEVREPGEQAVDERAVGVAGARVDDEAGRLVDDDHVVVDVDDAELDGRVADGQRRRRDRRRVDLDQHALVEADLARRRRRAVDA